MAQKASKGQNVTFCDGGTDILSWAKTHLFPFSTTVRDFNFLIMINHTVGMNNGAEEQNIVRNAWIRKKTRVIEEILGLFQVSKIVIYWTALDPTT